MIGIIRDSLQTWYLTGVVLWGFYGLLAAGSRPGLRLAGVALGAILGPLGVAIMLFTPLVELVRGARPSHVTRLPLGPRARVEPARGQRARRDSTARGGLPAGPRAADRGAAQPARQSSARPTAVLPTLSEHRPTLRETGSTGSARAPRTAPLPIIGPARPCGRENAMLVIGVLAGLGLVVSVWLPWGTGTVLWNDGHSSWSTSLAPVNSGVLMIPFLVAGAIAAAAPFVCVRRPTALLSALIAGFGALCFALSAQWLVMTLQATSLVDELSGVSGGKFGGQVNAGSGAWLALVGSLLAFVAACLSAPRTRAALASGSV